MSTLLPPGWNPEDVIVIDRFAYFGVTGAYRGTVNAAGRPHGRGDFDVTEGVFAGWAYSGDWVDGRAEGHGWLRWYLGGAVYAGAMRSGDPHGCGVLHVCCHAGAAGARLEGVFESGCAVGVGALQLAGGEVWRVMMERWVNPLDVGRWNGGAHPNVRLLELLGRVTEGRPPAPRREDRGRLPGPEWAATVERPDGAVVRVRCRSLAEVCLAQSAAAA
jgi:hypothetical protein